MSKRSVFIMQIAIALIIIVAIVADMILSQPQPSPIIHVPWWNSTSVNMTTVTLFSSTVMNTSQYWAWWLTQNLPPPRNVTTHKPYIYVSQNNNANTNFGLGTNVTTYSFSPSPVYFGISGRNFTECNSTDYSCDANNVYKATCILNGFRVGSYVVTYIHNASIDSNVYGNANVFQGIWGIVNQPETPDLGPYSLMYNGTCTVSALDYYSNQWSNNVIVHVRPYNSTYG